MVELDKIYNADCLEFMKSLPDNCIDVIITSPPYNKAGFVGKIVKEQKSDLWKQHIDYDGWEDIIYVVDGKIRRK